MVQLRSTLPVGALVLGRAHVLAQVGTRVWVRVEVRVTCHVSSKVGTPEYLFTLTRNGGIYLLVYYYHYYYLPGVNSLYQ